MNRHAVSLLHVGADFVQSVAESLVPVWDMAEVAFDPVSFRRNVEGKCFGTVVSDL